MTPRVLLLRRGRPPTAAGGSAPSLIALAGGEAFRAAPDAFVAPSMPGPDGTVTWEEVMEFDPQLVLIDPDPDGGSFGVVDWMRIEGWDRVEASVQGRVFALERGLFLPQSADLEQEVRALRERIAALFGAR